MINLVLSPDKINKYSICPTLYNYESNLRKTSVLGKPTYLDAGSILHEGLRLFYKNKLEGGSLDTSTIISLMKNYAAEKTSLPPEELEAVCNDFSMYNNYYGSRESWVVEAIEEPFAKVLYEDAQVRIVINGVTDLRVVTMNGKGPRAIVDHKYEERFYDKPDRDNQALAYVWGYEVKDFIFNRIGKQKSYPVEKRLIRPYFNYSQHQIDEWVEETVSLSMDILRSDQEQKYRKLYTGCTKFGKKCTFYEVCNTSPDNREYKIKTLFTDRPESGKTVMENR